MADFVTPPQTGYKMKYEDSLSVSYLRCHLSVVHPAQGGKVCGLCAVESVVEASMVPVGKGYHKLPFILGYLFMGGKNRGIEKCALKLHNLVLIQLKILKSKLFCKIVTLCY